MSDISTMGERLARIEERLESYGTILSDMKDFIKEIREDRKKDIEDRPNRYSLHIKDCENKYVFRREVRVGWVIIATILAYFGIKIGG